MISNVTFNFWKTWYSVYRCVTHGILLDKLGLMKTFLACFLFLFYITGTCRYSSVTFTVLLFNDYEKIQQTSFGNMLNQVDRN